MHRELLCYVFRIEHEIRVSTRKDGATISIIKFMYIKFISKYINIFESYGIISINKLFFVDCKSVYDISVFNLKQIVCKLTFLLLYIFLKLIWFM